MDKLIVTLNVSELKDLIAETIDSRLRKLIEVKSTLPKVELPNFLTRQEVANLFRVSLVSIDKWRRFGLLPPTFKQSGRTYFLKDKIEKFIEDKVAMSNLKNYNNGK
jgi:hypothetical protein|tara:strand:+ start:756 stop:1076 length:321 start_codon:yes stop_codon:yes gene_type:complete